MVVYVFITAFLLGAVAGVFGVSYLCVTNKSLCEYYEKLAEELEDYN